MDNECIMCGNCVDELGKIESQPTLIPKLSPEHEECVNNAVVSVDLMK